MKRFRALALYVDQQKRILGTLPGAQGDVLQAIRAQLEDEPARTATRIKLRSSGKLAVFMAMFESASTVLVPEETEEIIEIRVVSSVSWSFLRVPELGWRLLAAHHPEPQKPYKRFKTFPIPLNSPW